MHKRCWLPRLLMACFAVGVFALPGYGQAVRHTTHTGPGGTWVEAQAGPAVGGPPAPGVEDTGLVWWLNVAASITESVALSDTTNESWLGQNLNYERLSYLRTNGNGTPVWEYDLLPDNPDSVWVASAETASLGVVATSGPLGAIVRGFNTGGATPLWTYAFEAPYAVISARGIDVARDGSFVIVVAYINGAPQSLLVVLDGATGAELRRRVIPAYTMGVELSEDDTRAALNESATTEIIETAGLTQLFSFQVSGGGGRPRLSRDGKVVAAGGFNYLVYKNNGAGTWNLIYSGSESGEWLGNGIALSANGDTMFLVSHAYATGYLRLTYRLIDLVAGQELRRITTQGSGGLQDSVQGAEMSADGRLMAVISWGTEDNVHPELQIFDRQLDRVGGIDTPGSPFSIDMTRDGRYTLIGCKHVHANAYGNGGDAYVYEMPVGRPGDLNCDGAVNFDDINPFVLALSDPAGYAVAYPNCNIMNGDCNGDGVVNFDDINPFVALLTNP